MTLAACCSGERAQLLRRACPDALAFSTAAGPLANARSLQPEDSEEAPQESARACLMPLVPDYAASWLEPGNLVKVASGL